MLHGRRFVICGVNRLVVRVARTLTAQRADVTVLRRAGSGSSEDDAAITRLLPAAVRVLDSTTMEDIPALTQAGLEGATCLLALSDDDLDNLRIAVAAREAAPMAPVVLRAFDPALADQLEQGLNIRRAYSVSALAAPAFIAAACGDAVVETLRLGDGEVPICRLTIRPRSPLIDTTPMQIKTRFGCGVLARDDGPTGNAWRSICGDDEVPLVAGESVLIGGPLRNVLRLTLLNADWLRESGRRRARARSRRTAPPRAAPRFRTLPRFQPARHATLLPYVAAALLAVLLVSIVVFARALGLRFVDALYFVITTATTTGYGDISLRNSPDWLKLFGCLVMLSGGALLGILFSYLSALATAERLDAIMGRRASRMTGHVVLAGLGNLGYRIARLLTDLGMDVAVLELRPDARFVEAVRAVAPVLSGDSRLPENLERAAVGQAVAFIGCTNDELSNIQTCLHARRLNPQITTVARTFDDALAEHLTAAFAINRALSATQCAVGAFIGAATDERALRPLTVGGLPLTACRFTAPASALSAALPIDAPTIADWRSRGVRLLALRNATDQTLKPPSDLTTLAPGDEVILCGPTDAVREIMRVD